MSRYIDADALLLKIDLHGTNKFGMLDEDIREFIRSIPTADAAGSERIAGLQVSAERKYVIVCNEHDAMLKGTLLFWGSHTGDDEKRSFGGYTCQIDKCERYTRKELEAWRGKLVKEYPFFDELGKPSDFFRNAEVLISIDDLKDKMDYREFHVMAR